MQRLALLSLVLLAVGCASNDGSTGTVRTPPAVRADAPRGTLTADVFPFDAAPARFATSQRDEVVVRLEPGDGGAAMWITGEGLNARRIDWTRDGDSIYCSDGPDRRVEFIRIGVAPGTEWQSSGRTVRFEGWERIDTPAGFFDAARINTTLELEGITEVESWWFAPGAGLVKMRVDKADLYKLEMWRIP